MAMPTTFVLSALIDWITHLASRLVPSLDVDKRDKVASIAGASVNANAGEGCDKPPRKIFIPNTLTRWPWPRPPLNQYYAEVKAESLAWIASFEAFSPKAQQAFNRCDFGKTRSIMSC